jgi:bifunctional non-homologous end joining protein LigD
MSLKEAGEPADPAARLETYNAKRRFDRTREPRGRVAKATGHRFVVQQHDATRMHYDFRLELDGVLLSWAVPKGPSLSPAVKRLAVQTENHPVSYRDFEGEIPAGEYGGGTVIVWDRGRWEPEGDPREGLDQGQLSFRLDGEKLQGRFSLVRTGGKARHGPKSSWLLFKRSDEHARSGAAAEITVQQPASVITGEPIRPRRRASKTIAAPRQADGPVRKSSAKTASARKPRQEFPAFQELQPQLATLVDRAPAGADWVYEMKLDGYRMLAHLDAGQVRLRSRNNRDWSRTFPRISTALQRLKAKSAVLDGEVCFVDDQGRTHFQSLQNSLPRGDGVPDPKAQKQIVFYVFDLLFENGEDLRGLPLLDRKQRLRKLLGRGSRGPVVYIDHVHTDGAPALSQACAAGFEGLIAKRADAAYRDGRGPEWLKLKCHRRQEFVIVGMTPPQGARSGFGALLLALRKGDALSYAGKVGTGFSERSLCDLQARLQKLATARPAMPNPPRLRGVTWVRPELVCEIEFSEMTRDGSIRHPSFQGLREDKPAQEVVAEKATPLRKLSREAAQAKSDDLSPSAHTRARARHPQESVEVEGVAISHPQRVIDSASGLSKGELARYHAEVSEWFLPYASNRPLAIVRCPDGNAQECFFQKRRTPGLGTAVKRKRIAGNEVIYTGELRGILELVQFNAIEFHGWGAPAAQPERPDWLVFDLDPDTSLEFAAVIEAAQEVREALQRIDLRSFVRTTGGKGLHVVAPLEPQADWDTAKGFAQALADTLAAVRPDRYVAQMSKARRKGRIFIDYLRNGRGSTAVLPYSPRARAGTTVAMPVDWRDLAKIDPQDFTVRTVPALLKRRRRDPWTDFLLLRQRLPALPEPSPARRRRST